MYLHSQGQQNTFPVIRVFPDGENRLKRTGRFSNVEVKP